MKPRIFIGSSVEGLNIAYAIQQNLTHDAESTVWDQGVFELSQTSIESLTEILGKVDFGVFVFSPDDVTHMRGQQAQSVRDNVLFEFGLFVGKLSRQRVFFVIPEGEEVKIPTDLIGITPGKYDPNRQDKSFQAATGAACNQIRTQIKKLGFIVPPEEDLPAEQADETNNEIKNDWIHHYIRKEYPQAKEELKKQISQKTGDDALQDKAWLAYINLKTDEKNGLNELLELSEQYKDNVECQTLVARMFIWEDYCDRAVSLANEIVAKFPENTTLLKLKAECLKNIGDTSGAKSTLIDAHPEQNPEIAIELSQIFEDAEDIVSAIDIIHSAYQNFPNNNSLMFRYARLLSENQKHKEAVYLLNALTLDDPKKIEYWGYLSNSCLSLNLYDQAMTTCKKAEELSEGKQAWILLNIGNMLNNKNLFTEAIKWLNKGLEIDTASEYAHDRLAKAIKNKDEEAKKFSQICKEGKKLLREYKVQQKEPNQAEAPA